jgi:DNA-directed RNA polymerase specialized sigma24 family protein
VARKAKKRAVAVADDKVEQGVSAIDKIAGLLALLYLKDVEDKEAAALKLDAIGFTSHEISALLDVSENFVRVARHRKSKKR